MSKVFKSFQIVEAEPCQVELLDPAVFFIRRQLPDALPETESAAAMADSESESESEPDPVELAQKIVAEAQLTARLIVEQAQNEAESILSGAHQEAQRLQNEAHQAGSAEGREAGLTAIRSEMTGHLTQALDWLAEIETLRYQRILESEPEILKLAAAIAEKLLKAELELKPKKQLTILKKALARIPGAATYKIRLHPEDLEQLEAEAISQLQTVFSEPKMLELVSDPAVEPGGCYIVTDFGNIDARIGSQIELILSELLKVGKSI